MNNVNDIATPSGAGLGRTPSVLSPAPVSSLRSTTPIAGRAHRSRRNRPCDHCRRAKARCTIDARGPPCLHCAETDRQCTFDAAPPARKPRASTSGPPKIIDDESMSPGISTRRRRSTTSPDSRNDDRRSRSPPRLASASLVNRRTPGPSPLSRLPVSELSSFDHLAKSDQYDAHVLTVVLTDDLLPIAEGGEGEDDGHTHVKQISQDPKRPIFVVMDPKPEPFRQPSAGAVALTHIHALLRNHSLHITPTELYDLYHKQVHPALPILPQGSTETQLPLLLGSIIATALSHSKRTRELAAPVAGMLEISYAGLGEYNLSGVVSAVLDLGMRGVNSSRASYLLLAKTVALAQVLGMHISPKSWAIPVWEQELRVRLWWMLCIHDGWMSFLKSRPSHMQAHNTTVPAADKGALLDAACTFGTASSDSSFAFLTMCELSTLVHKLQRTCCTLGSMNRSTTAREDDVKELYKSTEGLLVPWQLHVSGMADRATGVASMLVHLLGFRCMLMRISLELYYGLSSSFEPDTSNLKPFHELVDFVQQLNLNDVDGYWLIYAGHILSSVVSSLIRLSMASSAGLNQEAMALLSRLVIALGRLHSEYGWDIAAPALSRAKLMAGRLKAMNEHEPLINALLGTNADPGILPLDGGLLSEPQQETALGAVEPQMVWDWNGMDFDFGPFSGLLSS